MLERQDIDALLIGSLYGELSSTEEARLAAHLDSHPADRTALADLSRARDVVRESRILQVQFEPPQSISALLIQEAVRRAPKARDGLSWFQRFMRSFVMHPAMAAAAMLVLVVGVAGTMYLRNGDQFAAQHKEDPSLVSQAPATPAVTTERNGLVTLDAGTVAAQEAQDTEAFPVKLRDELDGKADEGGRKQDIVIDGIGTDNNRTKDQGVDKDSFKNERGEQAKPGDFAFREGVATTGKKLEEKSEGTGKGTGTKATAKPDPTKAPVVVAKDPVAKAKQPPRLDVTTPTQAPKDFSEARPPSEKPSAKRDLANVGGDSVGGEVNESTVARQNLGMGETTLSTNSQGGQGSAGPGLAAGSGAVGGVAAPPKVSKPPVANPKPTTPAPATNSDRSRNTPPPPPPPAPPTDEKKAEKEKPDPELVWAKEQHNKVIAQVKAGKCQDAAAIAVQIANRNAGYFAANVETDRTIRPCLQYITAQREKEAEKVQRSKANKRAVDEAPARAPTSTSK